MDHSVFGDVARPETPKTLTAASRRVAVALATVVAVATAARGQTTATPASAPAAPSSLTGQLSPDMTEINAGLHPEVLMPATPADLARLPVPLAPGEHAFRGAIKYYDFSKFTHHGNAIIINGAMPAPAVNIPLMLVESRTTVTVYVNVHGDSTFAASDRIVLANHGNDPQVIYHPGDTEGWFKVPIAAPGLLKWYPYHMIYSPFRAQEDSAELAQHFQSAGGRYLWFPEYVAQGTITVDNHPTLVQYDVDPITGQIRSTGAGGYGMDCNGDGAVDAKSKTERMYRRSDSDRVVFQVGDRYLSPGPVDQMTGHFVVNQVSAAEYTFLKLNVGAPFPDFSFTDMTGQTRKLSDFRGKYVLLDFWEFGCGPCREDMPYLEAAYNKYKARGFEIVGMDRDDTAMLAQVKDLIHEKGLTWIQASSALPKSGQAIANLIDNQLRISGYPTVVLLDPNGNVASLNEEEIRGPALAHTLERLLPPHVNGG